MTAIRCVAVLCLVFATAATASTTASRPPVAVAASAGREGGRVVFVVRLATSSATPVTVRFATREGSARAGVDFASRSGTLRFAPGQTVKRITVRLPDDAEPEASETFSIRVARRIARGTIHPSDLPAPFTTVARMDGGRPLAGGNSNASGTATLTFEPQVAHVRYTVTLRGLGVRVGCPELHRGAAGAEGPELLSLACPLDNGSASGSGSLGLALILEIHAAPERFYVDVDTATHPFGAIRGQLSRVG